MRNVVAAMIVTLLVKGGGGDHGGGGPLGGGDGVEFHMLVVMMVVLATVVTLVGGSILAMKTVIVGMVMEMMTAVVAVARGRKIAKYRRKGIHEASGLMTLPDLLRVLILCLARGGKSNWVCGNSIFIVALADPDVPFTLGQQFLLTSPLFSPYSSPSHILSEGLPCRHYILGG